MNVTNVTTAAELAAAPPQRRSGWFYLRALVSLALVAYLLWRSDMGAILGTLRGVHLGWLVLALTVQALGKVVWALRWSALLDIYGMQRPFAHVLKAILVGQFFNNFLPTGFGGDFYRSYWLLAGRGSYRRSVSITLLERLVGAIALGYVALPAFVYLVFQRAGLDENLLLPIGVALVMLCGGVLLFHPRVFALFGLPLWKAGLLPALRFHRRLVRGLQTLHAAGRLKWRVIVLSLGVQFVGVAFYYTLGQSLGLRLQFWHYLVIVPLVVLAMLIPISLNGLGVREGMLVLLTSAMGVDVLPGEAVALGLLATAVLLVVSFIGGGFYIAGTRNQSGPA